MSIKIFLLFIFIVSALLALQQVTCAPLYTTASSNDLLKYPVVYRRFIRRRPPMYLHDKYTEEIIEIFHTKEKPPKFGARMSDEEIDKFIFCDFNRHLDECKKYWDSRKPIRPTTTTSTTKPMIISTSTTTQPTTIAHSTTTTAASKSEVTTSTSKPLEITSTTVLSTTESTTEIDRIPQLEETYYDYNVEQNVEINNEEEDNSKEELDDVDNDYYDELDF